jgi:hypothetical protein
LTDRTRRLPPCHPLHRGSSGQRAVRQKLGLSANQCHDIPGVWQRREAGSLGPHVCLLCDAIVAFLSGARPSGRLLHHAWAGGVVRRPVLPVSHRHLASYFDLSVCLTGRLSVPRTMTCLSSHPSVWWGLSVCLCLCASVCLSASHPPPPGSATAVVCLCVCPQLPCVPHHNQLRRRLGAVFTRRQPVALPAILVRGRRRVFRQLQP